MKIEWTDAAVRAAMHAYDNTLGRVTSEWADMMRAALDAATAEQFRPETDAEKVKRLEATMQQASALIDQGGSYQAESVRRLLFAALSYRKGA